MSDFAIRKEQEHQAAFRHLLTQLAVWNNNLNLTAIPEEKFWSAHIGDSLAVLDCVPESLWTGPKRALDLGTGAGFPGLPLAICFPAVKWTLLDSTLKKLEFIEAMALELGLNNVATFHGRAELIGKDSVFRESFDIVVSRAVADMEVLAELALPLLRQGGILLAYKSSGVVQEMQRAERVIQELGGGRAEVVRIATLPELPPRCMVVVKKEQPTPERFPRARVRQRSK